MSEYLTKKQKKLLADTYKLYNLKRFHSMNAATRTVKDCCSYMGVDNRTGEAIEKSSDCISFFSYYTKCVSWYPQARTLFVSPIVYDGFELTSTTTKQVNRFLRECVAPKIDISLLQYGFTVSKPNTVFKVGDIDILFSVEVSRLSPSTL